METVIRSPQDGVVKKLAHKEGVSDIPAIRRSCLGLSTNRSEQDICKAGTVLVQFEQPESEEE